MARKINLTHEMLAKALNKKRYKWVDEVMEQELPADIYASMHSQNFDDHLRAVGWLKEKGYHVKDAGEGVVQVMRGTTLVRQTKMVLELNDPEELLSVMEAVTENTNIPPPPWNPKAK